MTLASPALVQSAPSPTGSSAASSSYFASGRGHLILRSHAPLPRFACAIPVPPPTALVETLRNTVIAILTGQVSADSGSNSKTRSNGESRKADDSSNGNTGAALSYSEHLKQQTVHEWRCKSVFLELKQNAVIAPETRGQSGGEEAAENGDGDGPGSGFELLDDHECALLEHGDEVNVWLKKEQSIESLRLPRLSSRHVFGLPHQPALSRSGTLLSPQTEAPRSGAADDDFAFGAPMSRLRKPAEPSSHSSSVMGNPEGQYETSLRHRAAVNGQRILVLGSNGDVRGAGGEGVVSRTIAPAEGPKQTRARPRRMMSEGNKLQSEGNLGSSGQKPGRRGNIRSHSSGILAPMATSPPWYTDTTSPSARPASPPASPPLTNNKDVILASQGIFSAPAPSRAERNKNEKVRKAGQKGMPAQALIVGPGVQGKVGRITAPDARAADAGPSAREATSIRNDASQPPEYGNMDAFVAFTAAGSEMHQIRRPVEPLQQESSRSGTSDKNSKDVDRGQSKGRRGSESRASGIDGPSVATAEPASNKNIKAQSTGIKSKQAPRQYVKLPVKPEIPPIRNLQPFGAGEPASKEEKLMPMPQPVAPALPDQPDLEQDAALARALSEALNSDDYLDVLDGPSMSSPPTRIAEAMSGQEALAPKQRSAKEEPSQDDGHGHSHARRPQPSRRSASNGPDNALKGRGAPLRSQSYGVPPQQPADTGKTLRGGSESPVSARSGERESDGRNVESPSSEARAPLSRAERRYKDVQKTLETERKRQASAEEARRATIARKAEAKARAAERLEEERRQKLEKHRWEMWDEVRARQAKAPAPH